MTTIKATLRKPEPCARCEKTMNTTCYVLWGKNKIELICPDCWKAFKKAKKEEGK